MAGYKMTPARRAALKKAQIASARKRKGTGKGKVSTVRRRKGAATSNVKRRRRAAVAAVGAIGTVAGATYVYKNRERLIVARAAEQIAIRSAKAEAKAKGKRLGKAQIRKVRMEERVNHANRSRYRVQEYKIARDFYKIANKQGMTIRPLQPKPVRGWKKAVLTVTGNRRSIRPISSGKSIHKPLKSSEYMQNYIYNTYRKDVNARATHRLNRMKGIKKGFGYSSGKTKMVISGRVYRMPF